MTGVHYRHPAVLANMAAALDIISHGRLELGIGAGWNEEESSAYGIELGSVKERFDRFEEACAVLTGLLSQPSTTFDGKYYQLEDARNEPRARSVRARRFVSAVAGRNVRCGSPPAMPNTGILRAELPRNLLASAMYWRHIAPISGAIRKRSRFQPTWVWRRSATSGR